MKIISLKLMPVFRIDGLGIGGKQLLMSLL